MFAVDAVATDGAVLATDDAALCCRLSRDKLTAPDCRKCLLSNNRQATLSPPQMAQQHILHAREIAERHRALLLSRGQIQATRLRSQQSRRPL
jgi:hypothetical protein